MIPAGIVGRACREGQLWPIESRRWSASCEERALSDEFVWREPFE